MEFIANYIYIGLSTDTKPEWPEAHNGQIFKERDTGETYAMVNRAWVNIDVGLAHVKASKCGEIITDASGNAHVTFETPYVHLDYVILFSIEDNGLGPVPVAFYSNKTLNGFDITTRASTGGVPFSNGTVSWFTSLFHNPELPS